MGGKFKIRKYILPIILKNRGDNQTYVEPFCGGCNTLSEVTGPRIGADSHYYLIEMWKAVAKGWLPPQFVTKEEYQYTNLNRDDNPALTGYVGFACSFGAKWFGGYSGILFDKTNNYMKNIPKTCYESMVKQAKTLNNTTFFYKHYSSLEIPEKSIIYCDPPYAGTTGYGKQTVKFNHVQFWTWCRTKAREGHKVFISEYKAPDDFVCVWEKSRNGGFNKGKNKEALERLFVHRSQL